LNYWLKHSQKAGHVERGVYLVKAIDPPFLLEQATKGLEGWEPSHFLDVAIALAHGGQRLAELVNPALAARLAVELDLLSQLPQSGVGTAWRD
jgi:hypothetical protein